MANLEVLNGQPWAPNGAAMGQLKHPIRQVENVESQLVHRFRTLQFLIFTCFIVAGLRASLDEPLNRSPVQNMAHMTWQRQLCLESG